MTQSMTTEMTTSTMIPGAADAETPAHLSRIRLLGAGLAVASVLTAAVGLAPTALESEPGSGWVLADGDGDGDEDDPETGFIW